ncbi:MAG: iron-containing redox enzyme family protein [Rubrivivax sp.]|nr:iron-containing redox enzyme family protein [Rubrivivax sp.]
MSSSYGSLVFRTDEARREFDAQPVLLDAVARGMSLRRYQAFLLELYHVVWHFNPITAVASSRMPDSLRDVRYFLYEHMHEESGHELWVLNDLEAVGVPRERALAHAPGPYTLAMNGYNHWCASQRHPASVLGMFYALEVVASVYGGAFSSAVRESLLLEGDRGISFISSHTTMDADHIAELRQIVNTVDDAAALEAMVESATLNFHHFGRIFATLP